MSTIQVNTIDDVIALLDNIISDSKIKNSPLGYFAALYRKVTVKVKTEIANNYFDDGNRMEKLDVIFAKRYIDACFLWHENKTVTQSWQKTFEYLNKSRPIVLQHLLMGMNAHINLDLGIAAAEVSKNANIYSLENDFKKINEILSSLVNEVQNDLAEIWPTLKKILQKTKGAESFAVDFSMELAREGAWKFALALAEVTDEKIEGLIKSRDEKIAGKAELISNPGLVANLILTIIRLGEKGSVKEKIEKLL